VSYIPEHLKEKYKMIVKITLGTTSAMYSHNAIACLKDANIIKHAMNGIMKQKINIIPKLL
jgi:hypothetical protein